MKQFLLLSLTALLALASPAWGQSANDFTNCGSLAAAAVTTDTKVGPSNGRFCYDFDEGTVAGTETGRFIIASEAATVCLNADRNGVAGTAVVDVQHCVGTTGDGTSDNTCADTGITLSASAPCGGQAFGSGEYRLQIVTAATAGEDARVEVRRRED